MLQSTARFTTPVRWFLLAVIAQASAAQPATPPDPVTIFEKALAAHRGPRPATPRTLWFQGTVDQKSAEGDTNTATVEQWCWIKKAQLVLLTRIQVTGSSAVAIRGFDGRHYFVDVQGKKVIIDGNPTYAKDEAAIRQDVAQTRFIIDNFLVGKPLGEQARLTYLARTTGDGMASHKIARHESGGRTTIFYVNDMPGQPPYFNGIEFPAKDKQPKVNHCFGHIKTFGPYRVPQDIRIHENDSEHPMLSIWIKELKVDDERKPDWVRVRG